MAWQSVLKARWGALAPREQRALALAGLVVLLAVVWGLLVSPALRTLKTVGAQSAGLGSELERMQALQARAMQLQAKPALAPQDALKALQAAAAALGKAATLQVMGEQVTLNVKQISAKDLAPWLSPQPASGLHATEVHLQRDATAATAQWSGTLVFRLPAGATASQ